MLNCRNATKLMSESQDRALTITERMSLKLHIMMCSGCRNFREQMDAIRLMTRSYTKGKHDPADKM